MGIPEHIFRAYDIRGIYNKDINAEIMYNIGLAVGTYIKKRGGKEITVGNDIRTTSVNLAYSFLSGVISTGINAFYCGTTSFGQTLHKGWKLDKDITAFITASHLPPEWNGIKFYFSNGVGLPELELMKIRDICINKQFVFADWSDIGKISIVDPQQEYIEFFKEKFNYNHPIKVAVDCGGASTTLSAPTVIEQVGLKCVPVFCDPDPTFSFRPSEPKPKNLTELIRAVQDDKCAFGVAFDGDGDRSVIVDDKGRVLSADQTGIIIAKYGLDKHRGTLVANVECSKAVDEELKPLGFEIKRIPVGHTFLTLYAKNEDSPLGIESSGHIIIPNYFLFDDALIVPLKIAEILDKKGTKLSSLVDEIPVYPIKKAEIECEDKIKFKVMNKIIERIQQEYVNTNILDGVRIELADGWVLIRPSNTSPIIRLTAEANNETELELLIKQFSEIVENEIENYKRNV